jgi:hypothetical protein
MLHIRPRALLIGLLAAMLIPAAAGAQWWRHHPGYLQAMSDLRTAYWLMEHHEARDPVARIEEKRALNHTRVAYEQLKEAAIIDERDINDQPPADMTYYDHRGRLHRALDLLRDAYRHVEHEEEDPAARGLKNRALVHVDEAVQDTIAAIRAWNY